MKELSIAIVDDNPMVLNTLEGILGQEKDMSVIGKAENGEDALHMITDKSPDVVLLDLIMPKIDGISVVERIKQSESLKKIPAFMADQTKSLRACWTLLGSTSKASSLRR